jgi:hypothetical protein
VSSKPRKNLLGILSERIFPCDTCDPLSRGIEMRKCSLQPGHPVARIMMMMSMTACGTVAAMLLTAPAVSPLNAQESLAPTG